MSAGKGVLVDPDLRLLRWTVRTGIILLVLLGAVPKVQDAAAHPVALVALPVARAATWWRRLDADAAGAVVFLVGGIASGLRRASAAGVRPRRRR